MNCGIFIETNFLGFSISVEVEEYEMNENVVEYISSIKGGLQLCVNGFPYTRHRVGALTTYWRCAQFRPLK